MIDNRVGGEQTWRFLCLMSDFESGSSFTISFNFYFNLSGPVLSMGSSVTVLGQDIRVFVNGPVLSDQMLDRRSVREAKPLTCPCPS
ncbi:MAG: hypothetical protein PVH30_02580 [Desulfobacterales bacterium]